MRREHRIEIRVVGRSAEGVEVDAGGRRLWLPRERLIERTAEVFPDIPRANIEAGVDRILAGDAP